MDSPVFLTKYASSPFLLARGEARAWMAFWPHHPSGPLRGVSQFKEGVGKLEKLLGWHSTPSLSAALKTLGSWLGGREQSESTDSSLIFLPHCPVACRCASTGEGTCQAHGISRAVQASGPSAPARSKQLQRGEATGDSTS